MAISTLLFDKAPYKNVIVLGHVLDAQGRKMSKSKGNAVEPMKALAKHGADAIRWYFYENSAPWLPNRFHDAAVKKVNVNSWVHFGTHMHSLYSMLISINLMYLNTHLNMINYPFSTNGACPALNTVIKTVDETSTITKSPKRLKHLNSSSMNFPTGT